MHDFPTTENSTLQHMQQLCTTVWPPLHLAWDMYRTKKLSVIHIFCQYFVCLLHVHFFNEHSFYCDPRNGNRRYRHRLLITMVLSHLLHLLFHCKFKCHILLNSSSVLSQSCVFITWKSSDWTFQPMSTWKDLKERVYSNWMQLQGKAGVSACTLAYFWKCFAEASTEGPSCRILWSATVKCTWSSSINSSLNITRANQ